MAHRCIFVHFITLVTGINFESFNLVQKITFSVIFEILQNCFIDFSWSGNFILFEPVK